MIHRGPFQPRPFCDSAIPSALGSLGVKVPSQLGGLQEVWAESHIILGRAAAHSSQPWVLLQHLSPRIPLTSRTLLCFQDLSSSQVLHPPLQPASCLVILSYVPLLTADFRTCHFHLFCALAKSTTSLNWLQLASNSSISYTRTPHITPNYLPASPSTFPI